MTKELTVFEAANVALRQAYLGTSRLPINDVPESFLAQPPASVNQWRREDGILFRTLGSGSKKHAAAIIEAHAKDGSLDGWKIIRERL